MSDLSLPVEEGTPFYFLLSLNTTPKGPHLASFPRIVRFRFQTDVLADEPNTAWIYCNRCKVPTRHILVASHRYSFSDEGGPIEVWGEYRFWRCAGCDSGTMEDHYGSDYLDAVGDGDEEPDGHFYQSIYHPKRQHAARPRKYFVKLRAKLDNLYGEVVSSFNEEQPLLCAAGLRALVEGACADKQITGHNLEKKIEGMTKSAAEKHREESPRFQVHPQQGCPRIGGAQQVPVEPSHRRHRGHSKLSLLARLQG